VASRSKRTLTIILTILFMYLAFTMFSSSFVGATQVIEQAVDTLRELMPGGSETGALRVKVKILYADVGYGYAFSGNETAPYSPLSGVVVSLADLIGVTDDNGEVIFYVPQGNHTIRVERMIKVQGRVLMNSWEGYVNVDAPKDITVKFKLFRIYPSIIDVSLNPLKPSNPVYLVFNLPREGEYYAGSIVITFYTPWGEIRRTIGDPVDLTATPEELGDNVFLINYDLDHGGGGTINRIEEIPGSPSYIVPELTFLPVESVVVED